MKRILVALMVAGTVFTVAFAAAATLNVSGGTIQAGKDVSLVCDPDGVFVAGWGLETDNGMVYNVRVGGINGACYGNDLFANITGDGPVTLTKATAPNPIASSEVTLTFVTPQLAAAITNLELYIEGPY